MARTTHVKHARQRYATVPVLGDDGQPIKIPLTNKDGSPKTTKHGRAVTITKTVQDRNQPLPMPVCGKCGKTIEPGQPYKHISPRSGPYGGRTLTRCGDCPNWHVWEYSSSLSARIAQIQHDASAELDALGTDSAEDDYTQVASNAAEQIRELASEKEESASSLEDGFGHPTYQSEELNEQAESLNSWADEVEQADIPERPEDEVDCDNCDGTGKVDPHPGSGGLSEVDCDDCSGTGQVDNEGELDTWLEEARAAVEDLVNESPV